MTSKTAMQQAIEYLRKYNLLSAAVILEDKFLATEKQQIENAYNSCARNIQDSIGEQYYTQTYGQ